jgi:hypothetical protein
MRKNTQVTFQNLKKEPFDFFFHCINVQYNVIWSSFNKEVHCFKHINLYTQKYNMLRDSEPRVNIKYNTVKQLIII